jgi:hypothetical protein
VLDNVPNELAERDQWVNWRYEHRGGKPTKPPYCTNGRRASHSDPETWASFSDAFREYARGRVAGVGFVFTEDDPFVGIDFDNVRNPHTGALSGKALYWLRRLDSYSEISPSGEGFKVWVCAELPAGRHKKPGLEVYAARRFFTVTGARWVEASAKVEQRQEALEKLLGHEFPPPRRKPRARRAYRGPHRGLDKILEKAGVEVFREIPDTNAERVYLIACPWAKEHTAGDMSGTRVGQYPDGACFFCCEHAHCDHRGWRDFYRQVRLPAKIVFSPPGYEGKPIGVVRRYR